MSTQMHVKLDTQVAGGFSATLGDRIGQIAEERLRNSPYAALRTISCQCHDGVLILEGRLPTYYLKQVAQSVMFDLDGVLEIANSIEVVRASRFSIPSPPEFTPGEAAGS